MGHQQGRNDEAYATAILQPFLDKAFRRPVTGERVSKYVKVALQHTSEGNRFEMVSTWQYGRPCVRQSSSITDWKPASSMTMT